MAKSRTILHWYFVFLAMRMEHYFLKFMEHVKLLTQKEHTENVIMSIWRGNHFVKCSPGKCWILTDNIYHKRHNSIFTLSSFQQYHSLYWMQVFNSDCMGQPVAGWQREKYQFFQWALKKGTIHCPGSLPLLCPFLLPFILLGTFYTLTKSLVLKSSH